MILRSISNREKGSTFTFSIPIPIENINVSEITEEAHYSDINIPVLEDGQNISALVVDDREINRDILVNFLQIAGFDVEQASSGQQAIKMSKDKLYSLILMDRSA